VAETKINAYCECIGALKSACFDQAERLEFLEEAVKAQSFRVMGEQALAKLAQDTKVKALIGQGQMQRIFPIDPFDDHG
jgi:hypothetical protein